MATVEQASVVEIEELGGKQRTLTLRGAGLPRRGTPWSAAQRVATTWYPGNAAQATQQVIGPMELPVQWGGVWNTTRLISLPPDLDGDPIVYAHDLASLLEDIFRAGAQLRVRWANRLSIREGTKTIVREGRATKWTFPYHTIDDIIDWTIDWEWMGRGLPQAKVSLADNAREAALFATQQAAAELAEAESTALLVSAHKNIPLGTTPSLLGQLEALADAPSKLFKQVGQEANLISNRCKRIGDLINRGRGLPFEIAGQAVDVARNAQAVANNFVDAYSRTPPEQTSLTNKVSSVTRAGTYFGNGVRRSQFLARQAQAMEDSMRTQVLQQMRDGERGKAALSSALSSAAGAQFQVYLTMKGDTLLGVAKKFYGASADAGQVAIAQTNALRLTTVVLPTGLTLMIPPLTVGGGARNFDFVPGSTEQPNAPGGLTTQPGLFP